MDGIVSSFLNLFEMVTLKRPIYKVFGGSATENLALQNVQVGATLFIRGTIAYGISILVCSTAIMG